MNIFILIIAMFFLMWLLLIRPQRRRQMQQSRMLSDLQPGTEIVTAGGLYGTIESVGDDELMLEIAPGTTVRIARRAVAGVFPEDPEEDSSGVETDVSGDGPEPASDSSDSLHR